MSNVTISSLFRSLSKCSGGPIPLVLLTLQNNPKISFFSFSFYIKEQVIYN